MPSAHVEAQLIGIVSEVKELVTIPVAVKLSPFFSAFGNLAHRLDQAGADALVLFNRFYQPDINIQTRRVTTHAELSDSSELLLRLRWAAILHGRIKASVAVSGGVAVPADGIKALLAGATPCRWCPRCCDMARHTLRRCGKGWRTGSSASSSTRSARYKDR